MEGRVELMGDVMSLDQLDKMMEKLNALSMEVDGLSANVSELLGASFLDALSQAKSGRVSVDPNQNVTAVDVSGKGLFFGCGGFNGYSRITVHIDGVPTTLGGTGGIAGFIAPPLATLDDSDFWSIGKLSNTNNKLIYFAVPILFESSLKITCSSTTNSATSYAYMYTLL